MGETISESLERTTTVEDLARRVKNLESSIERAGWVGDAEMAYALVDVALRAGFLIGVAHGSGEIYSLTKSTVDTLFERVRSVEKRFLGRFLRR